MTFWQKKELPAVIYSEHIRRIAPAVSIINMSEWTFQLAQYRVCEMNPVGRSDLAEIFSVQCIADTGECVLGH